MNSGLYALAGASATATAAACAKRLLEPITNVSKVYLGLSRAWVGRGVPPPGAGAGWVSGVAPFTGAGRFKRPGPVEGRDRAAPAVRRGGRQSILRGTGPGVRCVADAAFSGGHAQMAGTVGRGVAAGW